MGAVSIAVGWRRHALHAVLPALLALTMGGRHIRAALDGGLLDPDSYMRLVRLEAILTEGAPLHVAARDASGAGTVLHWSHLYDSLLILLALPVHIWLDWHAALHVAALAAGPLALAALGVATAWAAAPFADRDWLWFGPLSVAIAPAIGQYGLLGVAHHHVPVTLVAVAMAGLAARIVARVATPGAGISLGRRLGAWAAFGLWLTPESVPLSVLAFGALWVAWLRGPNRRDLADAIAATGATFCLLTLAVFLVDPPLAGYGAAEIDRVSILFVGLTLAIAATGWAIARIDRSATEPNRRLILSLKVGLAAAGVWALCFPRILSGSTSTIAAADWRAFFDDIAEMRPVATLSEAARTLLTGALAAGLLAALAVRRRSVVLGYAALAVVALVAIGQAHVRFAAYPQAAGAVLLPVAIALAQRRAEQGGTCFGRLAAIAAFLLIPGASGLPTALKTAQAAAEPPGSAAGACPVAAIAGYLADYPGLTVLANVNDTPELLYRTPVRTVGSLYHRNPEAFLRLRAAWRSAPSIGIPAEVAATGASLVSICVGQPRSALVGDLPPHTLLDRLGRGDAPDWLVPIAVNGPLAFSLYWIVRK